MKKSPSFTKRTRKQTIIEALKEVLEEVKEEKRPSQTFQYLLSEVKQFKKFKNDEKLKKLEAEFNEWFRKHKR